MAKNTAVASRATKNTLFYLLLGIGALASIFPYLIALLTAIKPENELFTGRAWDLPAHPTLGNFAQLLSDGSFVSYFWHTMVFAAIITAGQLAFSSFAAYAFARMRFPGRDVIFWAYLATLMVPNVVTLIPLFVLMKDLGWVDSWYGLVAPYVLGTPYGIFLMRQFFRTIPQDLENAARIDGAGTLRILWSVILPLSRPVMATLAVITFVEGCNNLLWPLIISNSDSTRLMTVGLANFQGLYGTQWNLMLAATVVALLPLVAIYLAFQRHVVRSIVLSGLK